MYSPDRNLSKRFRKTMQKHNHTALDVSSLTGMTAETINGLRHPSKRSYYKVSTHKKVNDYLDAFENTVPNKTVCVQHTKTEKTKVHVYEHEPKVQETVKEEIIPREAISKYCDKLQQIILSTFIESYNKILEPIGYNVRISVEPINK